MGHHWRNRCVSISTPSAPLPRSLPLTPVGPVILSVVFCICVSIWGGRRDATRRAELADEDKVVNERRLNMRRMVRAQLAVPGVVRVASRGSDAPPTYGNSWADTTLQCGEGIMPPAPTYQANSRPLSVASAASAATAKSRGNRRSRDTVDSLESAVEGGHMVAHDGK